MNPEECAVCGSCHDKYKESARTLLKAVFTFLQETETCIRDLREECDGQMERGSDYCKAHALETGITRLMEAHTPNSDVCVPKRTNAYMEFCEEYRGDVIDMFPHYKPTEISKDLGKRWMNLTDSEKNEWKECAIEKNMRNGYL